MPPRRTKRTAFQHEGMQIFTAQRAAEKLLARAATERKAVVGMSRDELKALAQQLDDVAAIAAKHHLAVAESGSLSPDAFPPPEAS